MTENSGNTHIHSSQHEYDEIDLREIVGTILANKWFVIIVTFLFTFAAWVYTIVIPTKYEASALIQIDSRSNAASGIKSFDIPGEANSSASPSQIETALIKSRFVIQPAIESLGLDIKVASNNFPLLSKFFVHYHKSPNLAKPFLGMNKYAWGGEGINVKQFKVPNGFLGQTFTIVNGTDDNYQLFFGDKFILKGKVAELAESEDSSKIPGVKILITDLHANVGTEFQIYQQSSTKVLKEIAKNLYITDISGSDSSETGILNIAFRGTNQWLLPKVLNAVLDYDIQNNINKKNIEIQKTLGFLEQQVPIIKNNLEQAETALNDFRTEKGINNNTAGGKNILLDKLIAMDKSLEEIKLKKEELLQTFTEKHPLVISLIARQKRLEKELVKLEDWLKTLPKDEQKALSLERDIKIKDQLYSLLLSKIQELQIVQAGIVSDVRVLTPAVFANSLPSKQLIILGVGALCGLIFAVSTLFIRKVLTGKIDNPDEVEDRLGIPVYALIPHSREQKRLARAVRKHVTGTGPFILTRSKPKDLAIESLRSLRTMLQFTLQETKANIITILGASLSIGKSFVSLNLAQLFVDSGKRVLLIDSDIRKGRMHVFLGYKSSPGLVEILSGNATFDEVRHNVADRFDFVACSRTSTSPAELFLSGKFKELIASVQSKYDIIILDTPPILAVTEGTIITQNLNSVNLLLIGVGIDNLPGAQHVVRRLDKSGVKVNGLVFNNITKAKDAYGYGNYGYYYNYYNYYYDDEK